MGKKEQVPARAIFVQGSLWVWSATSRGRPPDGGVHANTQHPPDFLLVFMGNLAFLRPCYHALRQPVGAADRALQLL